MKEKEEERLVKLKEIEKELYLKGFEKICGIDEAGRGPLAGPVVVAAVIMPKDSMLEGVNDSKKISEKKREKLYEEITQSALAWGVGIISPQEIDDINILNATKKGLTVALKELIEKPNIILVDALTGIDTIRNSISVNYKRRCQKLFNCCRINSSKSNKGQNNAPVG